MFLLEIVTPAGTVLEEEVSSFNVLGVRGEFGALTGHTPFLTALKAGDAHYVKNGDVEYLILGKGFAEVTEKRVTCLVDTAQKKRTSK